MIPEPVPPSVWTCEHETIFAPGEWAGVVNPRCGCEMRPVMDSSEPERYQGVTITGRRA